MHALERMMIIKVCFQLKKKKNYFLHKNFFFLLSSVSLLTLLCKRHTQLIGNKKKKLSNTETTILETVLTDTWGMPTATRVMDLKKLKLDCFISLLKLNE